MNDGNYITIPGWMMNRLGLSGNKLLLYAVIYGFSQTSGCGFTGSLSYITSLLHISKPTAIKLLKELVEEGFVERDEHSVHGVVSPCYIAVQDFTGGKEILPGVVKKFNRGGKEILPGVVKKFNPIILNDNTNDNSINNKPPLSPLEKKVVFAEGVKLTEEEFARLCGDFGEDLVRESIQFLSDYKKEKGYKTKSDNLTLRRWVIDAVRKKKAEQRSVPKKDTVQDMFNYINQKYGQ